MTKITTRSKNQVKGVQPQSAEELAAMNGQQSENLTSDLKQGFEMNNKNAENVLADEDAAQTVSKSQDTQAKKDDKKTRQRYVECIAQNITSGNNTINTLETFGAEWDPVRDAHSIAKLTLLIADARMFLDDVMIAKVEKSDKVSTRRELFDQITKLFGRVFNQVVACGAPVGVINRSKSVIELMRGERMGDPKPGAKTKSVSHLSHTDMVEHVSEFIVILQKYQDYDSNQDDLKLPALIAFKDSLINENSAASKSNASWKTILRKRNKFFNATGTGYVDTFQTVKNSAKAIFGANSTQYHQLAQFKFRRIRS